MPPSETAPTAAPEPKSKSSWFSKEKLKEYGAVGITVHWLIFFTVLGIMYAALGRGWDISGLLAYVPFVDLTKMDLKKPGAGRFGVAWGAAMLTAPARTVLVLVVTPAVARWWRGNAGAPPPVKQAAD